VDRDYQRVSFDMQVEVSNTVINAAYLQATDANAAVIAELENTAY